MEAKTINLNNLFLDPNNYRLRSNPDWTPVDYKNILKPAIQKRTNYFITGDNNHKINDLIESIKINGFLKVDLILVRKFEKTNNYFVIEGNRRLAALKALKEQYEKGYDIGELKKEFIETGKNNGIEVVEYNYKEEKDYLVLMGLKHVSGNRKWDFYDQAKLLHELRCQGEEDSQIAKEIAINDKSKIDQQIRGYLAIQEFLDEIKSENLGSNYDPYEKLQMFIDLTTRAKLKKWIGWDDNKNRCVNKENKLRFYSWIKPRISIDEETDEPQIDPPIIVNHKQLRVLENILEDEEALEYLEESGSLDDALSQNFAYTQNRFSKVISSVEKTMRNIPIGTTLKFTETDRSSLIIIKNIVEDILTKGKSK
ncbi:MAG: ParB N-terminal domain-containing protein [Bacteroidota bacterium]|jgi:hypothetical protein